MNFILVDDSNLELVMDYTLKTLGGDYVETKNYYAFLIKQNGLFLVYNQNQIIGTGEIRFEPPYAYIGMTVDLEMRGKGYGTSIIRAMKNKVLRKNLIPLCGVDTSNIPSIKAIEKAGFNKTNSIHKFLIFS